MAPLSVREQAGDARHHVLRGGGVPHQGRRHRDHPVPLQQRPLTSMIPTDLHDSYPLVSIDGRAEHRPLPLRPPSHWVEQPRDDAAVLTLPTLNCAVYHNESVQCTCIS